jgi:predicted ATP-grasp superfamily ATP-dependent carboligase
MEAGDSYVEAILDIVHREKIDAVFPMTEVSIQLLNSIRDKLPSGVVLACSPSDKMAAVSNKFDLFQLAEQLDVPVPVTQYIKRRNDVSGALRENSRYPVVVKPSLSRFPSEQRFLTGGVMYAASREQLEHLYATKEILQYPSLIQEKIEGPGTGLFTLFDRDRHLALFSHRRLLEKPPSGGVSVVSESVELDEDMVEHARKLLSVADWQGVAMVEFKRDNRDGKAKLMEINGRFWGTLQLAVSCGIDFPALYLDLLQGRRPDELVRDYTTGHKMKWLLGCLDHLLIRMKNGSSVLNLPQGHPSRAQSLKNLLKLWERNSSYDVLDKGDLRPFAHEAGLYVRQVFRGSA